MTMLENVVGCGGGGDGVGGDTIGMLFVFYFCDGNDRGLPSLSVKTTGVTYYDRGSQICLGNDRGTQYKTIAVVY